MLLRKIQRLSKEMSIMEKMLSELDVDGPNHVFPVSAENDYSRAIDDFFSSIKPFSDSVKTSDIRVG